MTDDDRRPPVTNPAAAALRLAAEARRCQVMLDRATPPADVGPVPVAPARGACTATVMRGLYVRPSVAVPRRDEDWQIEPSGYRGRRTVTRRDAFDRMANAARSSDAARPFTPGQIAAGRAYAALAERYESAGIRCLSIEGRTGGGNGGSGGFMDAVCDDGARLRAIRARIGDGVALAVRRVRPSARGRAARGIITDRALVDLVCLHDLVLKDVLARFGWSATDAGNLRALRTALADALERMR